MLNKRVNFHAKKKLLAALQFESVFSHFLTNQRRCLLLSFLLK